MSRDRASTVGLLAISTALVLPVTGSAQDATTRAGARRIPALVLQLGATSSSADARERSLGTGLDIPEGDIPAIESRFYTDINGGLRFSPLPIGRMRYGMSLQSALRRYETAEKFEVLGHSVGGNVSYSLARIGLSGFGTFSYLPSYSMNATPNQDFAAIATSAGTLPTEAIDYSVGKQTSVGQEVGGAVTYNLSRRLVMFANYQVSGQRFTNDLNPSVGSRSMSGRMTYRLTRLVGLRLGFSRRLADYQGPDGSVPVVLDDVDGGLDFGYGRTINLTRTTAFGFQTGTNLSHHSGSSSGDLTGHLTLTQRIGSRGNLAVGYNRGASIQEGFARPVFSNSFSASASHQPTRHISAQLSSTLSLGSTNEADGADRVDTYSVSGRVSYSATDTLQVYGQYLHSGHTIGDAVEVVEGLRRDHANRSVRAGVTWNLTLRTQRAPRQR